MQCDLSVSDIFQAYYDCRKAKRNTWSAIEFEQNLERNLMDLYYELKDQSYQPGQSIMFVVTKPKAREVWAANFRDRVVHHVLYNKYSGHFYRRFIHDSYACIPKKGTLRAANKVQRFIRSATENHTKPAWFLKADVANFFVSIDKSVLDTLLAKHITDEWWMWLTRVILHKDPKENVYVKSGQQLLNKVPNHKSLLNAPTGFGLPIGNLSSQFFANIYLDELDQYAKHTLKLKHYARYVDDIVVVGGSGADLNVAYKQLSQFVESVLKVKFHPNKKEINRVDVGLNFVGYIIKPWSKYIRRSTIDNMYKRTKGHQEFEPLRATVNSYFGMLRQANAYGERKKAAICLSKKGCWFDGNLTKIVRLGAPSCISA